MLYSADMWTLGHVPCGVQNRVVSLLGRPCRCGQEQTLWSTVRVPPTSCTYHYSQLHHTSTHSGHLPPRVSTVLQ